MKKKLWVRGFILFLSLFAIAFQMKIVGEESDHLKIEVYGKNIDFQGQNPFLDKSYRTMVPIRLISEALGKDIIWDSMNYLVKIKDIENEIILFVDKNYGYVNGRRVFYDTKPILIKDRVYVPIRFISETLGYQVNWNQKTRTITIDYKTGENQQNKDGKIYQKPMYISHAGGRLGGETLTNTKDALEHSLDKGLNFIEVDISKTHDNKYVLIHGWDFIKRFFPGQERRQYRYDEFLKLNMINHWTQMSIEDAVIWMLSNEGVYIITDTKDNNLEMLSYISKRYKSIIPNIIPQIYNKDEYEKVKSMGFNNIIYTVYKTNQSDNSILEDARTMNLFAVAMPIERVYSGLAKKLDQYNIFSYCHTINDQEIANKLMELGVDGFYTDDLYEAIYKNRP